MTRGTTYEHNTAEWFSQRKLAVTPLLFGTTQTMVEAFLSGACDAVTQQSTGLATAMVATGKVADDQVLPSPISKEPHGPMCGRATMCGRTSCAGRTMRGSRRRSWVSPR